MWAVGRNGLASEAWCVLRLRRANPAAAGLEQTGLRPAVQPRARSAKGGVIMKKKSLPILILIVLTIGLFTTLTLSADVPMMTKDELKAMLGNPDLVIFDVRLGSDYFSSDLKIKGAVRPIGRCVGDAALSYPKGKTFVLYCSSPNEVTSISSLKHILEEHRMNGYTNLYVLRGGWDEWVKAGYPTEKK